MNLFKEYFLKYPKIQKILDSVNLNKEVEISEVNREVASLISLCLSETVDKTIVIVTPNIFQAQKMFDELSPLMEDIYFYPKDDFISTELLTESFEFKLQRVNTLKSIFKKDSKKIIITNLAGILNKVPLKESYESKIVELRKGLEIKPKLLINTLVEAGYERTYTVEKQGEVALRGGILDIFPINEDGAYRIDFFGNEIDVIKELNIETQRSEGEINRLVIMPKNEILFTESEKETIRFFINDKLSQNLTLKTREKFENDLVYLDETGEFSLLQKYISIFIQENYSFIDYIDDKLVCFFDYDSIKKQEYTINNEIYEYLSNFKDYFDIGCFVNKLQTYTFSNTLYLNTRKMFSPLEEISLYSKEVTNYDNRFDLLSKDLETNYKNKTVIITLPKESLEIVSNFFDTKGIKYATPKQKISPNRINLVEGDSFPCFDIDELNVLSISGEKLLKSYVQKAGKYRLGVETKRLKTISELKIGDYVVHYDYGIGKFLEITTMTLGSNTNDYIHIQYAKDQSVYIPVENLHVLSKYVGSESYTPELTNINGKEWEKTKASARKKATELAGKLLNLYSEREKTKGFVYLKDDDVQKEFEADFKYELTKDQAQTIEDVKKDMEEGKLMDRLICGDVGFGKTEVALRAAFKAVLSGKQVAYLAPTTILSRQHYHTFMERMDKFGVNIALVNRFVSPREIKRKLSLLKAGQVDIIIGTHRLLSKDVEFKNLGLLIIDEEQRFGVESKEKMKELKTNIDVLTLTATPIPRTLQMAIAGIKDVSLIETAPKGRYPVQTFVLERNEYIVKDAIEREMSKNGQVFYLYNRVEDIDKIEMYIHSLVPEARTSIIHGQMDKNLIEDTIEAFINKETDVLISTTIIETGIDIPNVNTLIVHDADRYGLSQLYQIKGRVGRSNKISYAYLMYDKNKILTEEAVKRLQAIKDFTELGSGFKIAIRDLSTRGAGEILGREQSGFMNKVGVDFYLRMLDEEVRKKKGEVIEEKEEDVRVIMSRHIDKDYISDDYVIIEAHEKISKLNSLEELSLLVQEFTDRFGPVKDNLLEYMYTKLAENLLNKCNFERIEVSSNEALFVLSSEKSKEVDGKELFRNAIETSDNFSLYYKVHKIFILYALKTSKIEMFKDVSTFIEKIKTQNIL